MKRLESRTGGRGNKREKAGGKGKQCKEQEEIEIPASGTGWRDLYSEQT